MKNRSKKRKISSDVYQAEDSDAEEDQQAGQRYDIVDNFQYELPEDFVDEEIDEELAFTEEDKQQMAQLRQGPVDGNDISEADELTRDDFSDDDSEADRRYGKPEAGLNGSDIDSEDHEAPSESDVEDIFAGVDLDLDSEDGASSEEQQEEEPDLDSLHKAVQDTLGPSTERKRRERQTILDEAVPESQFNLSTENELGELTLADMLAQLGPQTGKLSKAQKQLSKLAKRSQAVEAPLPGPVRSRKERQAGYEETTRDVAKWTPIVRVNREAPTLVFTNNRNDVPKTSTTAALAAKFKPESKMEAEVAEMLKAAGAQNEQEVEDAEEALALQAVTAEDLAKRKDELAKMRSLLFRHEEKSRHMAKIKSKDYHRRMKKSARLKAEKAGELDDTGFIRLQAEKAEFDRARERLTLKHKNTSQWARRALKRGVDVHDDGKKEAIAEQLRLGQELRRKVDRADTVAGSNEDTETEAETSSSESETEGNGKRSKKGLGKRATAKLQAAAQGILQDDEADEEEEEATKGLFSLPFMRRAQEKRKRAAQDEAQQLLAELEGGVQEEEGPTLGRRNFGLQGGVQANDASIEDELLHPESGSDADEDAEAKLGRLRKAGTGSRLSQQDELADRVTAAQQERRKGRKAKQKVGDPSAEADLDKRVWQGMTASTEGPTTINGIDQAARDPADSVYGTKHSKVRALQREGNGIAQAEVTARDGVLAHTAAGQKSLHSRAQILLPSRISTQHGLDPHSRQSTRASSKKMAVSVGPQMQSSGMQPAGSDPPEALELGSIAPDFIRSKSFSGEKPGYHFGKGQHGVGYYTDADTAVPGGLPLKRRWTAGRESSEANAPADLVESIAEVSVPDSHNDDQTPNEGTSLSQRELIARAFAGDDVAAEFEAEKEAEAEKELPKLEAPTILPGWGSWASSQKEPKWLAAIKSKVERQKQAARSGRKDAKLKAVSISERWDKRSAKYNSTSLPFPFTSKEAFEGSNRQPLGSDFNSQHSFREMTRPAVIKSSGVIIQPLKYSQGAAEEQKKVQKTKSGTRQAVARIGSGMAQPQRKHRK